MKKLEHLHDIFNKVEFGDKILFQIQKSSGKVGKPILATIVGTDVWDMAMVIYYVDYNAYDQWKSGITGVKEPATLVVKDLVEWSDYMIMLGHWKSMPSFRRLLKARRKMIPLKEELKLIIK